MIYFVHADEATTLVELLKLGFGEGFGFVQTYSDSEFTEVQTTEGRRRSFSDLLEIAQTYFPETTEEELIKAIEKAKLFGCFCNNINKVTFCQSSYGFSLNHYNNEKVGDDGYSLKSIELLLQS